MIETIDTLATLVVLAAVAYASDCLLTPTTSPRPNIFMPRARSTNRNSRVAHRRTNLPTYDGPRVGQLAGCRHRERSRGRRLRHTL